MAEDKKIIPDVDVFRTELAKVVDQAEQGKLPSTVIIKEIVSLLALQTATYGLEPKGISKAYIEYYKTVMAVIPMFRNTRGEA